LWANFRLAVSLVLRVLSLGTNRGLADHTALLMQVGMLRRARSIYSDIAFDAMKRIKLYQDALANKHIEAQNALIFAGRIAVLEGRPAAGISSFRKATRLQDDADARLLIGKQLAVADDLDGALTEYRAALGHPSIEGKPVTKAEAYRSIAEVFMKRNRPGLARQQLAHAQALEEPLRDYLGLGKTHALLGDLYASNPDRRNAALQAYTAAVANFERANDARRALQVKWKLRTLNREGEPAADGWLTRAMERCAQALVKAIERRRDRARKRED
jgi:tetratricopeptide (TPR) repeat protein